MVHDIENVQRNLHQTEKANLLTVSDDMQSYAPFMNRKRKSFLIVFGYDYYSVQQVNVLSKLVIYFVVTLLLIIASVFLYVFKMVL